MLVTAAGCRGAEGCRGVVGCQGAAGCWQRSAKTASVLLGGGLGTGEELIQGSVN